MSGNSDKEAERLKAIREYFEAGCLCIQNKKIPTQSGATPDLVAIRFYEQNCKCSRNYIKG